MGSSLRLSAPRDLNRSGKNDKKTLPLSWQASTAKTSLLARFLSYSSVKTDRKEDQNRDHLSHGWAALLLSSSCPSRDAAPPPPPIVRKRLDSSSPPSPRGRGHRRRRSTTGRRGLRFRSTEPSNTATHPTNNSRGRRWPRRMTPPMAIHGEHDTS